MNDSTETPQTPTPAGLGQWKCSHDGTALLAISAEVRITTYACAQSGHVWTLQTDSDGLPTWARIAAEQGAML